MSPQTNLTEMQNDIREIKWELLEILKERNPEAYLYFLKQIYEGQK